MNRRPAPLVGLAALLVLSVLTLACSSGGAGAPSAPAAPPPPSDEEVITALMVKNLDLIKAGDIATLMTSYTDDFSSDQGMNKAAMQQFLEGARDQGFLEGFAANTTNMVVEVTGDTAKVTGATVEGAFGVLNLGFGLAKRDGQWVVVSQTQQ
ncbi:MAG TPA: hypothetical protein VNB06_06565 [Thermoanaerobaculia bacterium]|nr:hypothetical protein [Thermoanaerobaculia bacterium]